MLLAGGHHHPSGRPVGHLVRWLAFALWGNELAVYHLLSVAVHTLVAFFLARLACALGMRMEAGMLGGLLFLVNVGHFKAVHHIAALEYPLAAAFILLALYAYERQYRSGAPRWLALFALAALAGLWSHAATVVVLSFVFYWSWQRGANMRVVLSRQLLPVACLLALGAFLLLKPAAAEETTTARSLSYLAAADPLSVAASAGEMWLWFFGRLFTSAHTLPGVLWEVAAWEIYAGLLLAALSAWVVYRYRDSAAAHALVRAGMALLPFALQPEKVITDIPGPSRYLYLASAGSSLVLGHYISRLGVWGREGRYIAAGLVLALLASSYSGLKKMEALSFYTSGRHYVATGDADTGIAQFRQALARGSDVLPLADTYYRLCNMLLSTGTDFGPTLAAARDALPDDDRIQALHYVTQSLAPDPRISDAVRARLQAVFASSQTLGEGAALRSMVATVFHNAALSLVYYGDIDRAVLALQQALAWDPQRATTRQMLTTINELLEANPQ